MTNAIEQTRITMYDAFTAMKAGGRWLIKKENCEAFESAMEAHLEALSKQTRSQVLGRYRAQVDQLQEDCRRLRKERDDIQLRLHAIDHAYNEQSQRVSRQMIEIDRHKVALNVAGEELIRAQGIARQHLDDCRSAEKLSDSLDERLRDAQSVIGKQEQLIRGQRLAIAELYMNKSKTSIPLSAAEVQSGYDRAKWAEGLIRQLPEDHEGRNSWLMNYSQRGFAFEGQCTNMAHIQQCKCGRG